MVKWILLLSQQLLSLQRLLAHIRKNAHVTRQWRSVTFHA